MFGARLPAASGIFFNRCPVGEKRPPIPSPRHETARQLLVDLLAGREMDLRDLSVVSGQAEKEVLQHLEHIRRSLHGSSRQLTVVPAVCRKCGFSFDKRKKGRIGKPGRCPVCRGESIAPPRYRID